MKIKIIFLTILIQSLVTAKYVFPSEIKPDILKKYAVQMLKTTGLTFEVEYLKKEIFSQDTVRKKAIVSFKKAGNRISFLKIFEPSSETILLMMNDTSWAIDLKTKSIAYLGGRTAVKQSGLFSFFPIGSMLFDTVLMNDLKYQIHFQNSGPLVTTEIQLENLPVDIKSFRYEIFIDTVEMKIKKVVEEASFGEVGILYQETNLRNYCDFTSEETLMADYFKTYSILNSNVKEAQSIKADNLTLSLDLANLHFIDLSNNPATIAEDGLIFLDLWYVGCLPCMKATPIVEKTYLRYKEKVHFYSVNEMDSDLKKIIRFKEKMGVTMPVLVSKGSKIAHAIGEGGYPLFVLLDARTGKILWKFSGYSDDLEQQFINGISPFLAEKN
jgi:thiol-disulfide isomerase/thioredoxin